MTSEQLLLFDQRQQTAWFETLWQQIAAERRNEVVTLLAKMARDSLTITTAPVEEEHDDEP